MDFQLTEQQELLQQTVRKFAQQECREVVALCDRAGSLRDPSLQKRMMELVEKMVQMGLIGMCLPEAYGGGGQELLSPSSRSSTPSSARHSGNRSATGRRFR